MISMELMSAPGRFTFVGCHPQAVDNLNAPDDQHISLFLDLADRLRC
jgi:hypothetical protein